MRRTKLVDRVRRLLALALLAALATSTGAQEPYLVVDLNLQSRDSNPTPQALFQGEVYFVLKTEERGFDLWKTDGSEAGTEQVKRISPNSFGSAPGQFFAMGDTLFFVADDGVTGYELWKTDGTEEGTTLVKDINPRVVGDDIPLSSTPSNFVEFQGSLYFTANDGDTGIELWVSDGTCDGTRLVIDLVPGIGAGAFGASPVVSGGALYFFGVCDPSTPDDSRLCRSEGTPESLVALGPPIPIIRQMVAVGGGVLFVGDDGVTGQELWRSDGTPEGTALVRDILEGASGSVPDDLTVVGNRLIFSARSEFANDGLWRSDGTEAGTVRVGGGCADCNIVDDIVVAGDWAFFSANGDGLGIELWVTDTTDEGTRRVADIWPGAGSSRPEDLEVDATGRVFFAADDGVSGVELWSSDGSPEGTALVLDIEPDGTSSPADLVAFADGGVAFAASEPSAGRELWRSDPDLGASRIADLNPWSFSSDPANLAKAGDRLLFRVEDADGSYDLWTSDGSEARTFVLESGGDYRRTLADLVDFQGLSYFSFEQPDSGDELWRTDGSNRGTELFDLCPGACSSSPLDMTPADGLLYLYAAEEGFGHELWRFDGTPEGTRRLSDICEGDCSAAIQSMTTAGDRAFFTAEGRRDGVTTGREVFTSDGTPEGTRLVVELEPGFGSAKPKQLTPIDDRIVFSAETGGFLDDQLWVTDGTAAGTLLIAPFDSGTIRDLTSLGDLAVFIEGFSELWVTDGTEEGTALIPGPKNASELAAVGDRAFFQAELDGAGYELWVTDGTAEGTDMVLDLRPGDDSSQPRAMTAFGDRAFFTALVGGGRGRELWVSDGTPGGTALVADVAPFESSVPAWLTPVDDTLFFTAYTRANGRELWAYTPFPTLDIRGVCPGALELAMGGLAPRAAVDLYAGIADGEPGALTDGPCTGRATDLSAPAWLTTVTADDAGVVSLRRVVGPESCGRSLQLVDRASCVRSRPRPIR